MVFLPLHTVHGVLKAGMLKWFAIPFSRGPRLSELSTVTRLSRVAPHGTAHSLTELDKAVVRVVSWLVFCDCGFHSLCALMEKGKRLVEASWWERLRGKLGIVLMGGAMLSKSLIQLFVDGQGCVPSLLFDLKPDYGGGNEDNGDLLQ